MDIALFANWQTQALTLELSSTTASKPRLRTLSTTISSSANNVALGVFTHATDKDFVAYNGDEPPWD
jgi:hypothetical protein